MHATDCHRAPYLDKLRVYMDTSANRIHSALQTVARLRTQRAAEPALAAAVAEIKRFQARRFVATYADLLQSPRYKAATKFFLDELYGDKDYAERDQQFSRIANTIEKLFPQAVVKTAAALAEVHALTESLDDLMGRQWLTFVGGKRPSSDCARYILCWRAVADSEDRHRQLDVVLLLGEELNQLTRKTGLRTLLRLMRGPAAAAGLSALQGFLESGFDAFTDMRGSDTFLTTIRQRETALIGALFGDELAVCETKLGNLVEAATTD
jgi:hypothetical protein